MKRTIDHQQLEIGTARKIDEAVSSRLVNQTSLFPSLDAPDTDEGLTQLGINYIDNSDKDFSTDAYTNDPQTGGDEAEECHNFYRQRFIRITDAVLEEGSDFLESASAPFKSTYTYPMLFFALRAGTDEKALVGTITRVDDETATMSLDSEYDVEDGIVFFGEAYAETSAKALKAEDHSLFAANEGANDYICRWDKTAGQTEIGGLENGDNFDIAAPLPINLATRGLDLFFSVNVKLREGVTLDNPVILYAGIYDTTSGNEKFLEADNFDLEVQYIGDAGANEYECIVVGTFNNGQQVVSDTVTVSNVGDLDADNFLDWDWNTAPRILDFSLYRRDTSSGDVVRVFTIYNGETRFRDTNPDGENEVDEFSTAPARREYAYVESEPFVPTTDYRRVPLFFRVPPTYAQDETTDRQILRIGVLGEEARCVVIDRVMLSLTESVWNRSARDLERIAATAPTSGVPDGNQNFCFTGWNPIVVKNKPDDAWRELPIEEAGKGMFIYGRGVDRILEVKVSYTKELFRVRLSNDIEFECTASERFITSPSDTKGTRLDRLSVGNVIESTIDGITYQSRIVSIVPKTYDEPQKVFTLCLEKGKIFTVGAFRPSWKNPLLWLKKWWAKIIGYRILAGAKAHNRKANDYNVD